MPLIAAGTLLIGICYGLARFAYGLFLPQIRADVGLDATIAGVIGSGAYLGYCMAIVVSALLVERLGPRTVAVGAALIAAAGMAVVALSHSAWLLAAAMIFAGMSTGLASPPMAQAVSVRIHRARQARANTVINAGTSLGVAISGPAAFLATGQWRLAYGAFALAALANALWLLMVMPRSSSRADASNDHGATLWRLRAVKLMAAATGMGIASAAFWTFAGEVITHVGDKPQQIANLAWIVMGLAGLAGAMTGDLIKRFGLNAIHRLALTAMALALWLIVAAAGHNTATLAAAALFGASYIMLTGIYLVWGIEVFEDRPAIGLGLPFLMIAIGQVMGSPLAGSLIAHLGYGGCFNVFAVIALLTMLAHYRAPQLRQPAPAT
ncbi:hypothetical protein BH688_13075 [Kushneria phosphatilytica]|nr:hypothetical protein BH688_13075 [Kushneria phosphatilytica]